MTESVIKDTDLGGKVGWRFEFRDRIDAEWVAGQLMKFAAFHVKVGAPWSVAPVGRDVKDALIRSDRVRKEEPR